MEKHLRVLNVTLDYPPPVLGGYGVMCAQVCTWLKQRGHEMLVLTRLPPEPGIVSAGQGTEEGAVTVSRTLRSYWDGSANLDPPFQEALAIEQHNQAQVQDVLATSHPGVVAFWHMGPCRWDSSRRRRAWASRSSSSSGMIGSAMAGGPMPGSDGVTSTQNRKPRSSGTQVFPHGCRTWERWGLSAS